MPGTTQVLVNAFTSINSVDLSLQVSSSTLNYSPDSLDSTAMGSGTTHTKKAGLLNWDLSVTFFQSYAAGNVNATLFPLVGAAAFPIDVRPDAGVRSATNPSFIGTAILTGYSPMGGKVGEQIVTSPKFEAATALSMAIA